MTNLALILTCVCYLCVTMLPGQVKTFDCPCDSMGGCTRVKPPADIQKEVFVVTNGTADYNKWDWESITAVLVPESYTKNNVMCQTHSKQKRYGFIATLNHEDHFDTLNNKTKARIQEISDKAESTVVDIVAVDLTDVVTKLAESEVQDFGKVLFEIKKALMPKIHKAIAVEMVCIVPWKPQCYGSNCDFTDNYVYHSCDVIILDASSFAVVEQGDACKARATVPFTHLALGVDEYAAQGLPEKRIILGVPWHGYKYVCDSYHYTGNPALSECTLPMSKNSNNVSFCDYKKTRTKMTIGEMRREHAEEITKSVWNNAYQAPVYTHFDNTTKKTSVIWFENIVSLRLKYQYAHDFMLKGIAIYTAEDLAEDQMPATNGFNGAMWDWVLHGILKTKVAQPPPVKYHADVVAGAAIGCLLLGLLMGVLFTCLALRHRVKKPRAPPFKSDQIEYHDDDDNLHL